MSHPHVTISLQTPANGCDKESPSALSGEVNIDSKCALDEQIREHEKTLARLKRSRNSLLNIHRLPPEVLSNIFYWNVMLVDDFGGLEKGSHNFLLICRHWFEVASRAPELWSFWGNTPQDWMELHSRSAAAPLDLVSAGTDDDDDHLDATISSVLRDYATRDAIRRVHLQSDHADLLTSILSSLTPEDEEVRSNRIESLVLSNLSYDRLVDVSDFFARYSFPKLRRIDLYHHEISAWDHIATRTGALTDLRLFSIVYSPPPTASQLFSILTSNPALQRLELSYTAIPTDDYKSPSCPIPLHHLKVLELDGKLRHVFNLLHILDHPTVLDRLTIIPNRCTVTDISQVIGPYLRNYLKHRTNSQGGLGVRLWCGETIELFIGDPGGMDKITGSMDKAVELKISFDIPPPTPLLKKAVLDLMAHVPREEVTHFWLYEKRIGMRDIYPNLPNLKTLNIIYTSLPEVFPGPDTLENGATLVSLNNITLEWLTVDNGDWSPLLTFLAHRASTGTPLQMLKVTGASHMCLEIAEDIKGMVEVSEIRDTDLFCPLGSC